MTVESRTLSAAERRERRLKRILGNSEERMKKILSGPDGDEHRLPPMLEGGEYRSSLFSSGEDDNCTVGYENYKDSNLSNLNSSPSCRYPVLESLKRMDGPLNLFFGFFVRILMEYGIVFNVLLPWILIFFGSHLCSFAKEAPKFSNDVMDILRSGNCSTLERIFKRGHAALSFLRVFTSRLLIMVCGFLIGHSAVIVFHKLPKDLKFPYT